MLHDLPCERAVDVELVVDLDVDVERLVAADGLLEDGQRPGETVVALEGADVTKIAFIIHDHDVVEVLGVRLVRAEQPNVLVSRGLLNFIQCVSLDSHSLVIYVYPGITAIQRGEVLKLETLLTSVAFISG